MKGDVVEAMVNALAEESDRNIDLEECVNEGVDECNLTKAFHVGFVLKFANPKVV